MDRLFEQLVTLSTDSFGLSLLIAILYLFLVRQLARRRAWQRVRQLVGTYSELTGLLPRLESLGSEYRATCGNCAVLIATLPLWVFGLVTFVWGDFGFIGMLLGIAFFSSTAVSLLIGSMILYIAQRDLWHEHFNHYEVKVAEARQCWEKPEPITSSTGRPIELSQLQRMGR